MDNLEACSDVRFARITNELLGLVSQTNTLSTECNEKFNKLLGNLVKEPNDTSAKVASPPTCWIDNVLFLLSKVRINMTNLEERLEAI